MQARGIFLTVLSAVLYGLNPLFSKTINVGGCNSLTQTFARLAAGIVIFFILLVCSGSGSVREKLRLSRQELKDILICCIGYGLIGPLLFASYNYLASGLATTLHFVYPVLVVVACIAFRYERANRRKLVCCALCFAGILCFYTPGGDVSAYGVFLALASGVAWAYYIVHLNSSGLVTMAPFKLAFWLCVFSAVLVGGITLAMGEFVWPSTAFTRGALALYCCVSTAASLLFQLGNRFIGAQSASMLSTFEPLTSVVIGILVYHEVLTVRLGIGIFCILLAVFLLAAIAPGKKTAFDAAYADKLYTEYKNRRIDDEAALAALHTAFAGKRVLILAPGATLAAEEGRAAVAAADADVTLSANFVPDFVKPDYAFFTNAKRFDESTAYPCPLILTSNLRAAADATVVNYDRLSGTDAQGGNSVLMLLRLLRLCNAAEVLLAGADGYRPGTAAYADTGLHTHTGRGAAYNAQLAGAIRAAGLPVRFITPSEYERA